MAARSRRDVSIISVKTHSTLWFLIEHLYQHMVQPTTMTYHVGQE